ncbi:MAG TPA: SpoIIE family protein phosphatase [Vicinamibacteria bacterium]|nr:SpoIIE family protein phosphatase [Vicinamibacteria bacterium]
MAEILIEHADGTRQRFAVSKDRVTIGRARESDIFLPDQWLSRQHAEIQRREGAFFLLDLGSKNGTLVNGERVRQQRRLQPGDVIALGEHYLTFSAEEADDDYELAGTRMFSARDLSEIKTRGGQDEEEQRLHNRLLLVLRRTATELLEHLPMPELFEKVLELLFEAVPAQRAAIVLHEGGQPVVKASRSRQGEPVTSVPRSIVRKVLDELKSVLIPNILEDASFRSQDSILRTGIRSAVCAPLWLAEQGSPDEVIGLVYLDSLVGTHSFTEEDLAIVTHLAFVAAAKIETSRLLEERMEKRRLEQDMQVAAEIQRSLLPNGPPTVPGYDIAGINLPCRTVGGDYYDYVVEGDTLLFALGDVSGKGTGAALLMTVLRAAVRGFWSESEPADAVERINHTVVQNVPANKYITFFLGHLDPRSGRIRYVNAGHNPPLLARGDGVVEALHEGGMVLGLLEGVPYQEGETILGRGDTLVVYSDGVTETWSDDEEEFGESRLTDVILRDRDRDAAGLQQAILDELDVFSGGAKGTDDRTLIVIKRA